MEHAPLMLELLDEVEEQVSAVLDGFNLLFGTLRDAGLLTDLERVGSVLDRIEATRDAVREMIAQEKG